MIKGVVRSRGPFMYRINNWSKEKKYLFNMAFSYTYEFYGTLEESFLCFLSSNISNLSVKGYSGLHLRFPCLMAL